MKKLILLSLSLILLQISDVSAQLDVTNSNDANQLANLLAGPGVQVSNAFLTCSDSSAGYFNNGLSTNLGLEAGVVLTSGSATGTAGPNNSGGFTGVLPPYGGGYYYFGWPGDADLDQIPGVLGTNDACGIQFDIESSCADSISFNYVFGSDEYMEFVGSFNDVFALYINGPDPGGGTYNNENIALIPGTTTVVSINNVNNYTNAAYYVDNEFPDPADPSFIQYDGFTVVLEAKFAIVPNASYTLRIVVADDLDTALDSGVFIEAGSLTSNTVEVNAETDVQGFNQAVEGCVNGVVLFEITEPLTDTLVLSFDIGGTAINGTDFVDLNTGVALVDSIVILPGDTTALIVIEPIVDGIDTEGIETIIIGIIDTCGVVADSVELELIDQIVVDVGFTDTTICNGQQVMLEALGADLYSWDPTGDLDDPNSATPIAAPSATTTYTVSGSVGPCVDIEQVTVNVTDGPDLQLQDEVTICGGESVALDASSSVGVVDFTWDPVTDLDDPTSLAPNANPTVTTTYTLTAEDAGACLTIEEITVNVIQEVIPDAGADELICNGQFASLNATGGDTYQWTPSTGLSCDDCPDPVANPDVTTTYTVDVSFGGACNATDEVTVQVTTFDVDAGPDYDFCNEGTVMIGPENVDPDLTYTWIDDQGNTYSGANPEISLDVGTDNISQSLTLTLSAVDVDGCTATDQIVVAALASPTIDAGENDTIFIGETSILMAGGAGLNGNYNWSPPELVFNPANQITTVRPQETTLYTVTGSTQEGCEGFDSVRVVVIPIPDIYMPTAFSPNSDGQNDEIRPSYFEVEELITYRIYNRWGVLVFETSDMDEAWDGTYKGTPQEIGAFAYYIEAKGIGLDVPIVKKGNITLIR